MTIEHRRSERSVDFLPLEVHAVEAEGGQILAGPFSGRIIDISAHGACLLMTQILDHLFHVFHSTRESGNSLLRLTIDLPPDLAPLLLTARPVWICAFQQREIKAFKMGVEFCDDPASDRMQEVLDMLSREQQRRGAWWQRHLIVDDA